MTRSSAAQPHIRALRQSEILEISNASMGHPGILAFWLGEPDLATPPLIAEAAIEQIRAGHTRYTPSLGLGPLRGALVDYVQALHGCDVTDRVAVTSSGTSSLMLALQAILAPGDRVVAVTPVWPNLCEMPKVLGAQVTEVSLQFSAAGWTLDLDALLAAISGDTRALLLNSPNNPTGWTITRAQQAAILAHCRRTGTWIIADDVYERLVFSGRAAPSFLEIAAPDERLIVCNSFSKAWRMTGWRLGWVVVPPAMLPEFGKLVDYNTTCAPPFIQEAGRIALTRGEPELAAMIAHLRQGQARLHEALATIRGVEVGAPAPGGMYALFRIEGRGDAFALCKDLVAEVGLGLAPGSAFGAAGKGFVRWCFASDAARIDDGVARLRRFLGR